MEARFVDGDEDFHMQIEAEENGVFSDEDDEVQLGSQKSQSINNNAAVGIQDNSDDPTLADDLSLLGNESRQDATHKDSADYYQMHGTPRGLVATRSPANYSYSRNRSPRRNKKSNSDLIDEKVKQELIGEMIAKTMKQLMMEGRLLMDEELIEQNKVVMQEINAGQCARHVDSNARRAKTTPARKLHENRHQHRDIREKSNNRKGTTDHSQAHLSLSELTLYERAIRDDTQKRNSSSSEEMMDTSDEAVLLNITAEPNNCDLNVHDNARDTDLVAGDRSGQATNRGNGTSRPHDEARPGPSGYIPPRVRANDDGPALDPEKVANEFIRNMEKHQATVYEVPGRQNIMDGLNKNFVHSMFVDERYCSVALHVDMNLRQRIVQGQYVDFAKLIQKDRILQEEDHRVQLVMKGGNTYFVPASDNNNVTISSLSKWDQAFRVFSDIYCNAHPERATELIQYSHTIHTAAAGYIWENVYAYDRDFRLHIGCNPSRSWSIILQQAWSMRLRDRIRSVDYNRGERTSSGNEKDYCKRFNKGRCTFGKRCKFEHRCYYCHKFGHGIHNCRKLAAEKHDGTFNGNGNSGNGHNHNNHHNHNNGNRGHPVQETHHNKG